MSGFANDSFALYKTNIKDLFITQPVKDEIIKYFESLKSELCILQNYQEEFLNEFIEELKKENIRELFTFKDINGDDIFISEFHEVLSYYKKKNIELLENYRIFHNFLKEHELKTYIEHIKRFESGYVIFLDSIRGELITEDTYIELLKLVNKEV